MFICSACVLTWSTVQPTGQVSGPRRGLCSHGVPFPRERAGGLPHCLWADALVDPLPAFSEPVEQQPTVGLRAGSWVLFTWALFTWALLTWALAIPETEDAAS